eukprot:TRINITY_DN10158_c0_g1_i1.p1 TRINITY_DN10158_c0_g1~~TRINITY_DN10158_c0_g1_i1.p1  ORF type:complete len:317 (+),score=28.86 TRINITY_DN10158_c0_g1_i1:535-1485(+)
MGEGTFGKVVECWDRNRKLRLAIKIVRSLEKYKDAAMIEIEILEHLKRQDPEGSFNCIQLMNWFEYHGHICMVFKKYGLSLYDFLKKNGYRPFSVNNAREIGFQLIQSIAFMHDATLIHTDLKPENILLASDLRPTGSRACIDYDDVRIKLIDFGSATYDSHHHTRVVSTRHYRAPEVILGHGWSYPCDIWSIACILVELVSGEALFVTHSNVEHLAMMARVLGKLPDTMLPAKGGKAEKLFRGSRLLWPELAKEKVQHGTKYVDRMESLPNLMRGKPQLCDLLLAMLQYEPEKRPTARQCLEYAFFDDVRAKFAM